MNIYRNDTRYWRIKNTIFVGDTVSITDQYGHYTKTFSVPAILAAQIRGENLFAITRDRTVWEIQIRSGARKKLALLHDFLVDCAQAEKILIQFIGPPEPFPTNLDESKVAPLHGIKPEDAQLINKVHTLEWERAARNLNQSIRQINLKPNAVKPDAVKPDAKKL